MRAGGPRSQSPEHFLEVRVVRTRETGLDREAEVTDAIVSCS